MGVIEGCHPSKSFIKSSSDCAGAFAATRSSRSSLSAASARSLFPNAWGDVRSVLNSCVYARNSSCVIAFSGRFRRLTIGSLANPLDESLLVGMGEV